MLTHLKPSSLPYSDFYVQMKNRQKRYRYRKNAIRRMKEGEIVSEYIFRRSKSCTPPPIQDKKLEKMYLAKDLELHNLAVIIINESYVNK